MGSRSDLIKSQRDLPASARRRGAPFTEFVRTDEHEAPAETPSAARRSSFDDAADCGVDSARGAFGADHVADDCATIRADRAIFTSIRSPMGVGYRITAASGGIAAGERGEITLHSPSHGNLVDASDSATGLAAYPLASGRYCVALSRHAGVEHTARGGQRVYTEAVVLSADDFDRFGRDPLRVADAVRATIGDAPLLEAMDGVEPLHLPEPTSLMRGGGPRSRRTERVGADECGRAAFVLGAVLDRRRLVVGGSVAARPLLDRIYAAVPAAMRSDLSWSLGLRFAIGRRLQLVFADSGRNELERMVEGQDIELVEWSAAPHECDTEFGDWVRLAIDRWRCGRQDELEALSRRLTQHDTPRALNRIARLARDLDRVETADPFEAASIAAAHGIELYPSEPQAAESSDGQDPAEVEAAAVDEPAAQAVEPDPPGDDPLYDELMAALRNRLFERVHQIDALARGAAHGGGAD